MTGAFHYTVQRLLKISAIVYFDEFEVFEDFMAHNLDGNDGTVEGTSFHVKYFIPVFLYLHNVWLALRVRNAWREENKCGDPFAKMLRAEDNKRI